MSSSSDDVLLSKVVTSFGHDVIKETLKSKFANPKNKITEDAIELMSEVAKIMVIEVTARAAQQANLDKKKKINLEHIETVLPQLVRSEIGLLFVSKELTPHFDRRLTKN